MYQVGKRIKMFREKRGFSQKDFASAIGQKNAAVSNWERGLTRPDVDVLVKICEVLNVSADELLEIPSGEDDLSEAERLLVSAYRKKTDLRHAVNILLGIEANDFCAKK